MLAYYDERAPEYEDAYTLGTGTASALPPTVFRTEAVAIQGVVASAIRGRVLDLACGTAYWLPLYFRQATHVTLFDQSAAMLDIARRKAEQLGLSAMCTVIQGDVFDYAFEESAYDAVLVGFLLSHLHPEQEAGFFEVLRRVLRPGGRVLLLDSAWSSERRRVNAKVEQQIRLLNNGEAFEVYKRYCDHDDIARWEHLFGAPLHLEYDGQAFMAVSGERSVAGGHDGDEQR